MEKNLQKKVGGAYGNVSGLVMLGLSLTGISKRDQTFKNPGLQGP